MAEDQIGVAVAQFAPGDDKAANIAEIRALAIRAKDRGAKLVVFPEYSNFFLPELGERAVEAAEALDGPFAGVLSEVATALNIHIVAGMLEKTKEANRCSNTLVAFDPSGSRVAKYRKIHLYDAFGHKESDWVVPGAIEAPELFRVGGLKVGLQTCYDLRFPEVTRRLVDAGADIVALPSEWVRGPLKEAHWRTLVTARAIENLIYVAAADQAPPIGAGNSMVVDPMGVELATVGEATDVAVGWASAAKIADSRSANPALALRRFTVSPK